MDEKPGTAHPVFDAQALAARTGQQGEELRRFAALFLDHLPAELSALQSAVRDRRIPIASKSAHNLAGTFAALAIDGLSVHAVEIEMAAGAGDFGTCDALLRDLEARCDQVVHEISTFIWKS